MARNLFLLLLATGVLLLAVHLAGKGANLPITSNFFDQLYTFFNNHFFEVIATGFLLIGIWNSIIRKRIVLSAVCFIISFMFSFLIPFVMG